MTPTEKVGDVARELGRPYGATKTRRAKLRKIHGDRMARLPYTTGASRAGAAASPAP